MSFDAVLTLAVVGLALLLMAREVLPADVLLLGALGLLVAADVVGLERALSGFAHPTLLTIGSLFVIAAALEECGILRLVGERILGGSSRPGRSLARLVGAVAAGSAFLNNTAIVAMGIPSVLAWCRARRIAPSQMLIPLSYASVLGGLCTLIGTSTNLVADSLLESHGLGGLGFFELAWLGLPCAVVGLAYLVFVAPRLLPVRQDLRSSRRQPADEAVDTDVIEHTEVAETAELRPHDAADRPVLLEGSAATLERDPAQAPAASEVRRTRTAPLPGSRARVLREFVVPMGSPVADETVRGARLGGRYGAKATGVRRGDRDVDDWGGDFVLRPGDALLLETEPSVEDALGQSTDLIAVDAEAEGSRSESSRAWATERRRVPQRTGAWICGALLAAVVVVATADVAPIAVASLLAAVALIALRLVSPGNARRSIDWSVLLTVGAALGVSAALETSGVAELLGGWIVSVSGGLGPRGVVAIVIAATMLFTLVITNTAAVALMFPVILAVADAAALDPRPLVMSATIAASLAFATPLSYQTNLMVYAAGGYRFSDFARVGLPLQLLLGTVAVITVPWLWPLG